MTDKGLVYIGKIIEIEEIPNADFIVCATVVCGPGGKWKGIVKKSEFLIGQLVTVYLPDAFITESDDMKFMESSGWRVRMRRFRGAPSEVLIVPNKYPDPILGMDCTSLLGVTKYHKPIPANLQGKAKGPFPSFIPKTDEPNYQNSEGQEGIEKLIGKPYYITEKVDGSSSTAYKYKGKFGVCSRNWELERDENNGYWQIAIRHKLEELLPEGIAIQWETCGPKIQGNPMGLKDMHGLLFSAYNIEEQRYLEYLELCGISLILNFPMVKTVKVNSCFSCDDVELLGEGNYSNNGKPREGVVVRSYTNILGHKPVSFKVINLDYEK